MNCIKTIFIATLLLIPAYSYADDLWSLQELTVLAFDSRDVDIIADEDNRGVRMVFSEWSVETERQIQSTLADTDIEYRLYPNRQAQMTVELYSANASLKFNMKQQHRTVQIIVGNARPELEILEVLLDKDSEVPFSPEVAVLLEKGDLAAARTQMLVESTDSPEDKELAKQRVHMIEAGLRGGVADGCSISNKSYATPAGREAAFLLSWCFYSLGNVEKAEQTLAEMKEYVEDDKILNRIENKRRQILTFSLLKYGRSDSTALLGNTFTRFAKDFLARFFSVTILENVADHLIQLGLGSILSSYADEIMAKLNNDELKNAAPALAECYLNAGQYVRAQDAASYFLEKPLRPWARGRLLLVRAHVNLREGNWKDAISDFDAAKQLILLQPNDELALMEAYVREARTPQTVFEPVIVENDPVNAAQRRFATRLQAEADLQQGKSLPTEKLGMLPDHALYHALGEAKTTDKSQAVTRISKVLAARNSSWAKLAALDTAILKMKKQLATELTKRIEP
ncbi:MAG: hypothetical protein JXX29_18695 [Deltaproteobacteria bacterium]|nr:hypothetical protein [Deltaproteobacteria bacterium]MBN2673715.1 hypothetical protein [Deltaproteobacteria bacterium]